MLEDPNFSEIVSWGYTNDSFVVKDMNSFTRSILPLHFKHSNFASFVRQLNKYDFHKVKNPEDGMSRYGEHTWEFKHPNFRADMKDNLEHIKVSQTKSQLTNSPATRTDLGLDDPLSACSARLLRLASRRQPQPGPGVSRARVAAWRSSHQCRTRSIRTRTTTTTRSSTRSTA